MRELLYLKGLRLFICKNKQSQALSKLNKTTINERSPTVSRNETEKELNVEMRYFNSALLAATRARFSDVSFAELERTTGDSLIREEFEDEARSVGKGYGGVNSTVSFTKVFISQLLSGNAEVLFDTKKAMFAAWEDLLRLNIPSDIHSGMISDAGQELAEALFCETAAGFIFRGEALGEAPNPEVLKLTPRAWLAGLLDSVSELSKLLEDELVDKEFSIEEEIVLLERYLEFGRSACAFLATFKGVSPTALNASRRPGQGFQGKFARVEDRVRAHQRDLIRLRREAALLRRLDEVMK